MSLAVKCDCGKSVSGYCVDSVPECINKMPEFLKPEVNDPVNRPAHYTSGKIEVIDFIEDQKLGFNLGNTVKYVARAGKKDPKKKIEDLKKAAWYLQREIKNEEANNVYLPSEKPAQLYGLCTNCPAVSPSPAVVCTPVAPNSDTYEGRCNVCGHSVVLYIKDITTER